MYKREKKKPLQARVNLQGLYCAANRTMKTQVLYHKVVRKGKQKLPFYISLRDIGFTALIFAIAISTPFLTAFI